MKRRLSAEERRLWRDVTRDVSAMAPRRAGETPQAPAATTTAAAPTTLDSTPASAPTMRSQHERSISPRASRPASGAYGGGDPRFDRRAANRRLPIDRRLDLHGMTQEAARRAFARFVVEARNAGCRCVLVITGKGGPASGDAMTKARLFGGLIDRFDPHSSGGEAIGWRPGVLRERVREWVDAPDIRPHVSRMSPARPKDGGAGAHYVFLKAPPRRS
ncbi:MAG: Smr/MutS family protein [Parvularculaceae bacterium]